MITTTITQEDVNKAVDEYVHSGKGVCRSCVVWQVMVRHGWPEELEVLWGSVRLHGIVTPLPPSSTNITVQKGFQSWLGLVGQTIEIPEFAS